MARVRRIIFDQDNSWLYRKELVNDPDAPTPQEEDYLYLPSDDGSEDVEAPGGGFRQYAFGQLSTPVYHSLTQAYGDPTVWAIGILSFGPPTQAQIDFVAAADANTDLSQFPGDHINVGFGVADEIAIGMKADFFEIRFAGGTIRIFANHLQIETDGVRDAGFVIGDTEVTFPGGTGLSFFPYDLREMFVTEVSGNAALQGTAAPQTLVGNGQGNQISAGSGGTIIRGGGGNDMLRGGSGQDWIMGEAGNDLIFGGTGDELFGGGGDDTITVNGFAYINGGDGTDTLVIDMSAWDATYLVAPSQLEGEFAPSFYATNIERLEVEGSAFADVIVGSNRSNVLRGGAGIDRIYGGSSDDVLDAGQGLTPDNRPVVGGGSSIATARPIDINFNNGTVDVFDRILVSGGVSDQYYRFTVSAGGSIEIASTYNDANTNVTLIITKADGTFVDQFGDTATLTGLDAGDYVVEAILEDFGFVRDSLTLTVTASVPAITGNQLFGGLGDDTYYVYSALDQVFELAGEGDDTIISTVSYTLPSFVERLVLAGDDDIDATGNDGDNVIVGNSGDNVITGLGGDDVIDGGAGLDTFVVNGGLADAQIAVSAGVVTITTANGGTDTLTNVEQIRFAGTGQIFEIDLGPEPEPEPQNTPPNAVNDTATVRPGRSVTIAVLANDSDADDDPVTLTGVGAPTNGTAILSGGSVVYTANANFAGTDTFTYSIADGNGGTDTGTVTVTVANSNTPPAVIATQAVSTLPAIGVSVTVLAVDPDGDTLTYTADSAGHGTVTANGGNKFVYTPTAGYTGSDQFAVTVSDGMGGTAQQQVFVTVRAIALADDFRVIATDGFSGLIGGSGSLFGTQAIQQIYVNDQAGTLDFDTSFNRGGDVIHLDGTAFDWQIARSGSNAILSDSDTVINLPVGLNGVVLVFDDGARTLKFDSASQSFKIGAQSFTTLTDVTAAPDGTTVPGGTDPDAEARVLLSSGGQVTVGGRIDVFGTLAADRVTILSGEVSLDPSFNRGGDTVLLPFDAEDFTAVSRGSQVVLSGSGIELSIPIGQSGLDLQFSGGDERTLLVNTMQGIILLGDQTIGTDPVALAAA